MAPDRNPQPSAPGETTLMPYWERVASRYAASDPLAAVCYPAAPRWFNRFYAHFQLRTVERMLGGLPLAGTRALDVGCGGGRWTRWLAERGAEAIGVDPTTAMLETARRLSPGLTFQRMSATTIDFPADTFDLVMAVTVIQHLRPVEQERAAAAMCRVVRQGGHLFVFDLIDQHDPGRVVFPRRPQEWIDLYQRQGMTLVRWEGQEYVPLMRALTALLPSQTGKAAESNVTAPSVLERIGARRAAFASLWPVIQLSYPLESLCERLLPAARARHGCFLFRKADGAPRPPHA
ncbi:MAG: class I SAM-dependent methyltransferase [Deltaproteobacteria bacterium]|nr:class I SAM-dependent methyltransferase [Deltaproteobacteria bacterium]